MVRLALPYSLLASLVLLLSALPSTESKFPRRRIPVKPIRKVAPRGTALSYGPVPLGQACQYTYLAQAALTVGAATKINGNIAMDLGEASFGAGGGGLGTLTRSTDGTYSTTNATGVVSGRVYATDYNSPTPANIAQAILDMQNAQNYGMQEAPPSAPVQAAADLNGKIFYPGIYKYTGAVAITGTLTLKGNCTDVFLFQIGGAFNPSGQIVLSGGVTAASVFFVASGAISVAVSAVINGIMLSAAAVSITAGTATAPTTITGMVYSQAALSDGGMVSISPPGFCQNTYTGACLSACSNICPPGSPSGTNPSTPAASTTPVYVANPSNGAVEPNLGAACPFIGVGSSIANTVTTSIGGDLASTGAIAGMSLTLDPTGYFYTSNQVSGKVYMPYANGTIPSQATNAETAIRAAYD